jgi:tetratricopeptide (TPR) repeat protein
MSPEAIEHVGTAHRVAAASPSRPITLGLALGLAVVTAIVYAPLRHHEFICFDDPDFVVENPHVHAGLTWGNFLWAWTEPAAGTWQAPRAFYVPLTAMSYLLDAQLFGLDPGAFHLTNLLFHIVNTLLVFALFVQMTAQPWPSAWIAGMFALHPLHVESVAWIAERKDVVSTCFWLLTILAYVGYVRRPGMRRFGLVLVAYVAALLSKQMGVTLPLALLLLDVWPLRRLAVPGWFPQPSCGDPPPAAPAPRPRMALVLLEKLPLILLAAMGTAVAVRIQSRAVSLRLVQLQSQQSNMADRVANALVSYVTYLRQLFWPTHLAGLYPFELVPATQALAAAVLLLGITGFVVQHGRRHPYLLVGWFWYILILLPTLGLVRTLNLGVRADRYTYVAAIGIFIIVSWGVPELLARWRHRQFACGTAAAGTLAACIFLTGRQVPTWRNSLTLARHALTATHDNLVAEYVAGTELLQQGQADAALPHFMEVTRIAKQRRGIDPPYWERVGPIEPYRDNAEANIGLILTRRGDLDGAKDHYLEALASNPADTGAHYRLGIILGMQGDLTGALAHYRAAVRAEPDFAAAHNNLAITLEKAGQTQEALTEYAEGVRLEPENAQSRCNFAAALAGVGRPSEAIEQFRAALQLRPQLLEARVGVASAYAQVGQTRAAIAELEGLLREQPDWPPAQAALAWLLATTADPQLRDGTRAVQLAEAADRRTAHDNPEVLNALAAAYAERGQFAEAVATAEHALALAQRNGPPALLDALPARLAQYRAGAPVRDDARPAHSG